MKHINAYQGKKTHHDYEKKKHAEKNHANQVISRYTCS